MIPEFFPEFAAILANQYRNSQGDSFLRLINVVGGQYLRLCRRGYCLEIGRQPAS
jgi:hypothetical protein